MNTRTPVYASRNKKCVLHIMCIIDKASHVSLIKCAWQATYWPSNRKLKFTHNPTLPAPCPSGCVTLVCDSHIVSASRNVVWEFFFSCIICSILERMYLDFSFVCENIRLSFVCYVTIQFREYMRWKCTFEIVH